MKNTNKKFISCILIIAAGILFLLIANENKIEIIAHQGNNGKKQENTIVGLQNSIDSGYKAVECDLTEYNGKIYIAHDAVKLDKIDKLDTVEELNMLIDMNKDIKFYVEFKEATTQKEINYVLGLFQDNKNNVVIQVSTLQTFEMVKEQGFEILVLQFTNYTVAQYVDFCNKYSCYVGFGYSKLDDQDLEYINNNFSKDIYWTIDDNENYQKLEKYKPYGIMTNTKYGQLQKK